MLIKFWGVRGSIPTPGLKTIRYGGNTSCIEIRAGEQLFIVDSGTGIRELGNSLLKEFGKDPIKATILLTHTHWDHIHGFPFFTPAYIPRNEFMVCGPISYEERLEDIMSNQMKFSYFPVKLHNLQANISFRELQEEEFIVDAVKISTRFLNHPILTLGYKLEYNGKTVAVITDTEPFNSVFGNSDDGEIDAIVNDLNAGIEKFIFGADLVIFDSQYTESEYSTKIGWGHSTFDIVRNTCLNANVKHCVFFHHDPERTDDTLDQILIEQRQLLENNHMILSVAKEGEEICI